MTDPLNWRTVKVGLGAAPPYPTFVPIPIVIWELLMSAKVGAAVVPVYARLPVVMLIAKP